jgi:hypothetical protein
MAGRCRRVFSFGVVILALVARIHTPGVSTQCAVVDTGSMDPRDKPWDDGGGRGLGMTARDVSR